MDKNKPVKKTELELIQEEEQTLVDELVLIRSRKRLEAFKESVKAEKNSPYKEYVEPENLTNIKSCQYSCKGLTLLIENKPVSEIKKAVLKLKPLTAFD